MPYISLIGLNLPVDISIQKVIYMNELLIPQAGEYGAYYENYISWVKGRDIPEILISQIQEVRNIYDKLGESKSNLAYTEGKWSAKEVLGHITDTDRIMAYRALSIARGENTSLPGYDQDAYVIHGKFNEIALGHLLEEFELSRFALVSMLKNLPKSSYANVGIANNTSVTVRALFNIIAGHTIHHLNILKDRYI
ncbi:DinB family protein [Cecembia rubra]|uniref:DinB family protein n=1 Tax=Cecembia rubra TaxID=1485585 RepID=A0A2P8DYL0_9BACT|nr:DinB family protein [Cecembia rubra]PSL02301.1 DinB family protein [Cecembia rubra]